MEDTKFKVGQSVERIDGGEKGTIRRQFEDGSVSLVFEGGWAAELSARALRPSEEPSRTEDSE